MKPGGGTEVLLLERTKKMNIRRKVIDTCEGGGGC